MSKLRNIFLPILIAVLYWFWSHSWRLKILEHPEFIDAKESGAIVFAHWHGDEMVVLRMGPKYHCAAMTSTSSDGELMTRVLKIFGFGISRGSSTRGGARALIGMIDLIKKGFAATMAVDGPKGPRHVAKPGIWYLAKHTNAKIIPTGVAKRRAWVFEKSWNKTFIPWPFSRVVVSFGPPIAAPKELNESALPLLQEILEEKLHFERGVAQAQLLGGRNALYHN